MNLFVLFLEYGDERIEKGYVIAGGSLVFIKFLLKI